MTEFASNQAELASENVTAFTEIAKKVQMETVEIIMAAGKEMTEEASSAVKKPLKMWQRQVRKWLRLNKFEILPSNF